MITEVESVSKMNQGMNQDEKIIYTNIVVSQLNIVSNSLNIVT